MPMLQLLLLQLQNFINTKSGRPEGNHDDLVFAFSHALYCYSNSKAELLTDVAEAMNNSMLDDSKSEERRMGIEFMRRNSNLKVWQNLSVDELQEILEEEEAEREKIKENNKINIIQKDNQQSNTERIFDAFFQCF